MACPEQAGEFDQSSLVPPSLQIRAQEIYRRVLRRHPPLKGDAARAVHADQVAVPRRLGRVAGQRAVRAMVGDEFLEVGKQLQRQAKNNGCRSIPLGITPQQTTDARAPTCSSKGWSRAIRTAWRISVLLPVRRCL